MDVIFSFYPSKYMSNVDSWCKACGEVDLPSELQDLEDAIHHHQGVYEHVTLAYSEVGCCHLRSTAGHRHLCVTAQNAEKLRSFG